MILRNWRSASSIPAAVQRKHMSPFCQRLTLRLMRRTVSIIDSPRVRRHERALEPAAHAEPGDGERLLHALAQRGGGAGVGTRELVGERTELVERAVVVIERPGCPQPSPHHGPVAL